MIVKGYNVDSNNQEALLHKHVSEYGINLSHKESQNIFIAHKRPRNCINSKNYKKNVNK